MIAENEIVFTDNKVSKFKTEAKETLNKIGVPSTKLEPWKYTSIKNYFKDTLTKCSIDNNSKRVAVDPQESISSYTNRLIFINGHLNSALSTMPDNVKLYGSNDTIPESFSRERNTKENIPNTHLAVLNSTSFDYVLAITLPKNEQLSLEISYISTQTKNNELVSPRVFVELETGATLNLVERFTGYELVEGSELATNGGITSHMVESFLEEDATFNHYKIQEESDNRLHLSLSYSEIKSRSVYKNVNLNFGSALARNEVYPVIMGENATTWLLGSNVLTKSQHVDNFTCIDHVAPNCESHELYKGMYADKSKGIFTGTIIVREEAQKTNAYQSNASLLCSDSSESISRPQLKIWADDVKCSHGATVGQLDEEALFYLRARGIPEAEAKSILTQAYVCDVFSHLEDEKLATHVQKTLERKLSTF